jgi:hypothetical protein
LSNRYPVNVVVDEYHENPARTVGPPPGTSGLVQQLSLGPVPVPPNEQRVSPGPLWAQLAPVFVDPAQALFVHSPVAHGHGLPHRPSESHVSTPPPEHCVADGLHAAESSLLASPVAVTFAVVASAVGGTLLDAEPMLTPPMPLAPLPPANAPPPLAEPDAPVLDELEFSTPSRTEPPHPGPAATTATPNK